MSKKIKCCREEHIISNNSKYWICNVEVTKKEYMNKLTEMKENEI